MRLASALVSCVVSFLAGAPDAVTKVPPVVTSPRARATVTDRLHDRDHHVAGAAQPASAERAKKVAVLALGRSVGSPTEGKLLGGAHLDDAPYLRIVPAYAGEDVRWGLGSLVGLVDRSARAVRRQFPDAVLSAGHLSRQGGGELDRHASHESGRDADIGFYVRSQTSKALYAEHFVAFKGDGTAPSWPGAYFDDARNWALVAALVSDPLTHVTHIFVATPLRARLLAYAERAGAPQSVRAHAAEVMAQPRGALPHDDHFHVRVGCPSAMTGCIENPTASKPRFARVPLAHGRARPAHAASPPPPSAPAPMPAPPPQAGPPPSTAPDPERTDEAPAMLIDDVDGVMAPPAQ